MDRLVCVRDYEQLAEKVLQLDAKAYFNSGATDEFTLKENCDAFKRIRFRPKVLRDVSKVDTSTNIFGHTFNTPIFVAPTAICKWAHESGELGAAKAAGECGSLYTLSAWATTSIEEVARGASSVPRWMQLQKFSDSAMTLELIRRAEGAGFQAFVFTVDTPVRGTKYASEKRGVVMPKHLKFENLATIMTKRNETSSYLPPILDEVITWEDIDWLKKQTRLPIIVKGILTAESSLEALSHGVDGIFVSNHGGRQLDGVPATIDVLSEIVQLVDGRCPIYFDGGVRCGADVAKALILGADAVFVGRPVIWGLACEGQKGVANVLTILQNELKQTMQLLGVTSISEMKSDAKQLLIRTNNLQSKL